MYSCGFNSKVKGMAPGVKKVDRVARYNQMQQQWDKDRWVAIEHGNLTGVAVEGGGFGLKGMKGWNMVCLDPERGKAA
jgi:hypothetical protein